MIDMRREASQIATQFDRFHHTIGESVVWYVFDARNSHYDSVYDEGNRKYMQGRNVPVLWVDQQEAAEDYAPEGRRPTQRLRFAVGTRQLQEAGIRVDEAHGNRIHDTSPSTVWREDRLNDVVYYDGRFYEVSGFNIRGRLQGEDIIIGVSCIETQPSDELNLDATPVSWFPASTAEGEGEDTIPDGDIFFGPEPPPTPQVGDLWFDTEP